MSWTQLCLAELDGWHITLNISVYGENFTLGQSKCHARVTLTSLQQQRKTSLPQLPLLAQHLEQYPKQSDAECHCPRETTI